MLGFHVLARGQPNVERAAVPHVSGDSTVYDKYMAAIYRPHDMDSKFSFLSVIERFFQVSRKMKDTFF